MSAREWRVRRADKTTSPVCGTFREALEAAQHDAERMRGDCYVEVLARLTLQWERHTVAFSRWGRCPACDAVGPHEDNGLGGTEHALCCRECGEQWDGTDYA